MDKNTKINIFPQRVKLGEKISFVQNLGIMIKSGISIVEALEVVKEDIESPALSGLIDKLSVNLKKGKSIYDTLSSEPDVFSQAHMGIIQAGEISGQLYESFERIKDDLQKEQDLAQKVKSAMTYPIIIFIALIGIGGGVITFILPKLAETFERMGIKLPLPTRIMVAVGTFVGHNMLLTGLMFFGLIAVIIFFITSKFGRNCISAVLHHTPLVKTLIKDLNYTRFSRTLSVLIASGINLDQALTISSRVFSNKEILFIKDKVIPSVRKGESLSDSLKSKHNHFPGLMIRMVSVGESSGNLAEVLAELSTYYDKKAEGRLAILTNMMEPLLMLVVGLVIGGAVLSIIAPIYNMVGTLQQSI